MPTGIITKSAQKVRLFKINLASEGGVWFLDLIRIILSICLLVFVVIEVISRKKSGISIINLLNMKNFMSLAIIITMFISIIIKYIKLNLNKADLFSEDTSKFIDTNQIANDYASLYLVETILLGIIIAKLIGSFTFNSSARLFYQSFYISLQMYLKYIFFVFIVLIIFSSVAHILWGPYIKQYSDLQFSMIQTLFLTLGYFDYNSVLAFDKNIAVVYLLLFYLVIFLFMYTAFVSFYAEGLRLSVVKSGYPSEAENSKWNLKDYIMWICHKKKKS